MRQDTLHLSLIMCVCVCVCVCECESVHTIHTLINRERWICGQMNELIETERQRQINRQTETLTDRLIDKYNIDLNRGFWTRTIYLDYITCLRYTSLVRNPWNVSASTHIYTYTHFFLSRQDWVQFQQNGLKLTMPAWRGKRSIKMACQTREKNFYQVWTDQ